MLPQASSSNVVENCVDGKSPWLAKITHRSFSSSPKLDNLAAMMPTGEDWSMYFVSSRAEAIDLRQTSGGWGHRHTKTRSASLKLSMWRVMSERHFLLLRSLSVQLSCSLQHAPSDGDIF